MNPISRMIGSAAFIDSVTERSMYNGPNSSRLAETTRPRCLIRLPAMMIIPEPSIYPSGILLSSSPN
ncbi:hypothetical protein D3C72_1870570 [compost metagenome]